MPFSLPVRMGDCGGRHTHGEVVAVRNLEVAWALEEMADLIEIRGIEAFKARAYRRAAAIVASLSDDIADIAAAGALEQLPGIGRSLAGRIGELIATGTCAYLEELKGSVPEELRELLAIPGVGAKTASALFRELGIRTIEELEHAARAGRIRNLKGMSIRTEQRIQSGIERMRTRSGRIPLGIARPIAEDLAAALSLLPAVTAVDVVGSIRRRQETAGDINLLAASERPQEVLEAFGRLPQVAEVLAAETSRSAVVLRLGCKVDLRVVAPDQFVAARHYLTGSAAHNARLVALTEERGLPGSDYGLPATGTEADVYAGLRMQYVPPELREGRGEVEAALKGELPELVDLGDIHGDLHLHTDWSDGANSIAEVAERARQRGYNYVAVTDHSQALAMVGGLGAEKLARQAEAIATVQQQVGESLRILRGIEVDIMSDGRLDLADDVLRDLDIVVASVHRGFRQGADQITARIEAALKHPLVDIVAHPTGRLIGRRDEYAIDLERVFDVAAATGTALEINSSPDRLDLSDVNARRAGDLGIRLAINTDAHDLGRMTEMEYGVAVARRAWRGPSDILNAQPLEQLLTDLGRK